MSYTRRDAYEDFQGIQPSMDVSKIFASLKVDPLITSFLDINNKDLLKMFKNADETTEIEAKIGSKNKHNMTTSNEKLFFHVLTSLRSSKMFDIEKTFKIDEKYERGLTVTVEKGKKDLYSTKTDSESVKNKIWGFKISSATENIVSSKELKHKPTLIREKTRYAFTDKNKKSIFYGVEIDLTISKNTENGKAILTTYEIEMEKKSDMTYEQFINKFFVLYLIYSQLDIYYFNIDKEFLELSVAKYQAFFKYLLSAEKRKQLFIEANTFIWKGKNKDNLIVGDQLNFYRNEPRNIKAEDLKKASIQNYAVSCKLDGKRKFIWVAENAIYSINIPHEIVKISDKGSKDFKDTILDSEMLDNLEFYVFDVIRFQGQNVEAEHFKKRLSYIKDVLKDVKSNFKLIAKKFNVDGTISDRIKTAFTDCKSFKNSDGLIFQPLNKPYLSIDPSTKKSDTLKWKPVDMITIDFVAKPTSSKNIFDLYSQDTFNKKLELFEEKQAYIKGGIFKGEDPKDRIIEFQWDEQEFFIPVKFRDDKVIPNKTSVALDDWEDIQNPITEEMIRDFTKISLGIPKKDSNPNFHMRKYHNSIKEEFLQKYLEKGSMILDIGSGKGGDVDKWKKLSLEKIFAVEPNKTNLKTLKERVANANLKNVEILNLKGEDTDEILEALKDEEVNNIVAFFSLTYIFESEEVLDDFVETINKTLKAGGKFIGIVLDGNKVKELLGDEEEFDNVSFSIKKGDWDDTPFGNNIYTNIKDSVTAENIEEYLFDFKTFSKKLKEIGVEVVKGFEKSFITNEPANVSEDSKVFSHLNRIMVFEKKGAERKFQAEKDREQFLLNTLESGKEEIVDIDGTLFTRVGAPSDNSSIIHAICQAFSKKYEEDPVDFVKDARSKFSHGLTLEKFKNLADKTLAKELIENFKESNEENAEQVAFNRMKKLILDYDEYVGDNFEILQHISNLLNINIFTLNFAGAYVPKAELKLSRTRRCELLYKPRKTIIILNVNDVFYETIKLDGKSIFSFNDKVIQKLYKNICFEEKKDKVFSNESPKAMKKRYEAMDKEKIREFELAKKKAEKVKKLKDKVVDYEKFSNEELSNLLKKRKLDHKGIRYDLVKRLQHADEKISVLYESMSKKDLLKILVDRNLKIYGVSAKDLKPIDKTKRSDIIQILLEDDLERDVENFVEKSSSPKKVKSVSPQKKSSPEKVKSPVKSQKKSLGEKVKSTVPEVEDYIHDKQIYIPFDDYKRFFEKDEKRVEHNGLNSVLFMNAKYHNIDFPFKKYYEKSPEELFNNLQNYAGQIKLKESHTELVKSFRFNSNFLREADFAVGKRQITFFTGESEYHDMDVFTDVLGQEENRLKTFKRGRNGDMPSPWDYYYTFEGFGKILQGVVDAEQNITMENLREGLYATRLEATQFKPSLAKTIYDLYNKQSNGIDVLDISAGWGDRLAGAIASGVNSYTGYDPNTKLKPTHDEIIKFAKSEYKNFKVVYEPFEKADLGKKEYDLVFSSPPFFDYEVYSTEGEQSALNYPSFDSWIVEFLFRSMKNAWHNLKVGGSMVIHISDVPTGKIVEPMILFAITQLKDYDSDKNNCKFMGVMTSLAGAEKHRPMWVFKKIPVEDNELSAERLKVIVADFSKFYPTIYKKFKDVEENIFRKHKNREIKLDFMKPSTKVSANKKESTGEKYTKDLVNNKDFYDLAYRLLKIDEKTLKPLVESSRDDYELFEKLRNIRKNQGTIEWGEEIKELGITERAKNRIGDIKKYLATNAKYLDIGSGNGEIAYGVGEYMKTKRNNMYFSDVKNNLSKIYKNQNFVELQLNKAIELSDVNIVTAFQVLHHAQDVEFRLENLHDIMSDDGILIIREHDCRNDTDLKIIQLEHGFYNMVVEKYDPSREAYEYGKYRSREEWTKLLAEKGFELVEYKDVTMKKNPSRHYYGIYKKIKNEQHLPKNFEYSENSCFIDSVLFMLLNSNSDFVKDMVNTPIENNIEGKHCTRTNRENVRLALLDIYNELRSDSPSLRSNSPSLRSDSPSLRSVSCTNFRKLLKKCRIGWNSNEKKFAFEDFSSGEMMDADEFLKYLFTVLGVNKNTFERITIGTNILGKHPKKDEMVSTSKSIVEDASPITTIDIPEGLKSGQKLHNLYVLPKDSGELDEPYKSNGKTYKRRLEIVMPFDKNNKINIFHINRYKLDDEEEEVFDDKFEVFPEEILTHDDVSTKLVGIVCWEDAHYTAYSLVDGQWTYSDDIQPSVRIVGNYEQLIKERLVLHNSVLIMYEKI